MFARNLNFKNNRRFSHNKIIHSVKSDVLFLCHAEKNTKYIVDNIFAGHCLTQRLLSIGIIPGEVIGVGDISAWGPVTVFIKGIKIALGRGVAGKIALRRIKSTGDDK
ncbi:MAG: FeoA domain-containing protein [Actinomycetota bacterium]|nr:FeoA domain-containing protein [Actinomycetota bacterium]